MAKDKICKQFVGIISPENKFTVDTIEDLKSRTYLVLGDVVELNGYYAAGDGAHHKRKIEANDDGSGVQLANGLWANVVHNGTIKTSWVGEDGFKKTSGLDVVRVLDKKAIIREHNGDKLGNIMDGKIELDYQATNGCIITDSSIENVMLDVNTSKRIDQAMYGAGKIKIDRSSIVNNSGGHCVQLNNGAGESFDLTNSKVEGTGYGILVNSASEVKELNIQNNKIVCNGADAIELNLSKQDNYRIQNNLISCWDGTTVDSGHASSGFAIGIAKQKNGIISGNIVTKSRQEGFHLEDGSNNTIVNGNLFLGNQRDGMWLMCTSESKETPILTSNIIEGGGGHSGIYPIYDSRGRYQYIFADNNIVKNFAKGTAEGSTYIGNNYYSNCSKAMSGVHYGTQILDGCGTVGASKVGRILTKNFGALKEFPDRVAETQILDGFELAGAKIYENEDYVIFRKPREMDGVLNINLSYDTYNSASFKVYVKIEDYRIVKTKTLHYRVTGEWSGFGIKEKGEDLAVAMWQKSPKEFLNFSMAFDGSCYFDESTPASSFGNYSFKENYIEFSDIDSSEVYSKYKGTTFENIELKRVTFKNHVTTNGYYDIKLFELPKFIDGVLTLNFNMNSTGVNICLCKISSSDPSDKEYNAVFSKREGTQFSAFKLAVKEGWIVASVFTETNGFRPVDVMSMNFKGTVFF